MNEITISELKELINKNIKNKMVTNQLVKQIVTEYATYLGGYVNLNKENTLLNYDIFKKIDEEFLKKNVSIAYQIYISELHHNKHNVLILTKDKDIDNMVQSLLALFKILIG
jgi:hypothetical protein